MFSFLFDEYGFHFAKSDFGNAVNRKGCTNMATCKIYTSDYPDNMPKWYWTSGLHDACIVNVDISEFPFEYDSFVKEKGKYTRNLLTLKIDASQALFDTAVKEIRLYNYKILTDKIDLQGRKKIWWLADRLIQTDNGFILEIHMEDLDAKPRDFTYTIKFERAEVDRK